MSLDLADQYPLCRLVRMIMQQMCSPTDLGFLLYPDDQSALVVPRDDSVISDKANTGNKSLMSWQRLGDAIIVFILPAHEIIGVWQKDLISHWQTTMLQILMTQRLPTICSKSLRRG